MEHVQHTRNPTAHNYRSQTVYSSGLQSMDGELAPFQGLHEVTPIFIINQDGMCLFTLIISQVYR